MTPTPEQSTILSFATIHSDNLIVNALAGTGKTSTIELICKAIPSIPILYLAFNRGRIAVDRTGEVRAA